MKWNIIYKKFNAIFAKLTNWYPKKHSVEHPLAQEVTITFNDTVIHWRFADDDARRTFHYDLDGETFILHAGPIRDYVESFDYYGDTAKS